MYLLLPHTKLLSWTSAAPLALTPVLVEGLGLPVVMMVHPAGEHLCVHPVVLAQHQGAAAAVATTLLFF